MQLKLSVTTAAGTADITGLIPSITWSGEYTQCSRTLTGGILSSPVDTNVPVVDIPLGSGVRFEANGQRRFSGHVFTRQKSTESNTFDITCYDGGFYLKKNRAVYKFTDMTPEDVTRRVCEDFGIPVGALARTGEKITRNFIGVSLYQIIQTAYTLASYKTGDKYHIRFSGDALNVVIKDVSSETLIIQGGSNMMSAAVTESIANMINQVAIYDADENMVGTVKNEELIGLYGLMQEYLKQSKDNDAAVKASKLLEDNGVSQKITINNLGSLECVTGNAVVVREPHTGLYGLFWIDSDTHTWKNGLYLNKLVLNFRRMMDEQEAGSLPTASYSGGGSTNSVSDKWEYLYKSGEGANAG